MSALSFHLRHSTETLYGQSYGIKIKSMRTLQQTVASGDSNFSQIRLQLLNKLTTEKLKNVISS